MAKQTHLGVWKTIIVPFAAYLFLFVGMGLVAGSVVHFGETEQIPRFLSIGFVGMVLFVIGSYIQESLLNTSNLQREGILKYVLYSLILAIGIGMISGGTQHFLDFPLYASYLLPVGFILALVAYIFRNNLNLSRKGWTVLMGGAMAVALPTFLGLNVYAKTLPVSSGHHGEVGADHSEHSAPSTLRSSQAQQSPSPQSEAHSHAGHPHAGQPLKTAVKLTGLSNLGVNRSVAMQLTVLDEQGQPVENFDRFQEKLMHLIVVSDDLAQFEHLHPTYEREGQFQVLAKFAHPGNYTLFSDYQPMNESEAVSSFNLTVPGAILTAAEPDFTTRRSVGAAQADLLVSPAKPQAGQDVSLTFVLKDRQTNQALQGLQPYLGEKGHLVIVKRGQALSQSDYIHAHAMKDGTADRAAFMTTFPKAGQYKLWGQFKRGEEIIVADFWVNVAE